MRVVDTMTFYGIQYKQNFKEFSTSNQQARTNKQFFKTTILNTEKINNNHGKKTNKKNLSPIQQIPPSMASPKKTNSRRIQNNFKSHRNRTPSNRSTRLRNFRSNETRPKILTYLNQYLPNCPCEISQKARIKSLHKKACESQTP